MLSADQISEIGRDGFTMCRGAVAPDQIQLLVDALDTANAQAGTKGLRNLLRRAPDVRALANSTSFRDIVTVVLGPDALPVRAILFDKTPESNWGVGWHQDLTIAVKQRVAMPGFDAWTVKDGVPHVQPPVEILEQMLTLRLHLDAASDDNGALLVSGCSHLRGRVDESAITRIVEAAPVTSCGAAAGDLLAFRPLLLHMSRKSRHPDHRRVIQIEYAAVSLPPPLQWYQQTSP